MTAEHPMLFSSEMVRAILEGRKTQTRRVIKPQPSLIDQVLHWNHKAKGILRYGSLEYMGKELPLCCPYGKVGDLLWVRETYCGEQTTYTKRHKMHCVAYKADEGYRCGELKQYKGRWRPSIFMPKWAARIWLEITGIKVERVQDISRKGAEAEGCKECSDGTGWYGAEVQFCKLWDSLNAKRGYGWSENPFCWVLSFKRVAD